MAKDLNNVSGKRGGLDYRENSKSQVFAEPNDVGLFQPLVLALVGDSVQSLYLRQWFAINTDLKVNLITKNINKLVNARAQSVTLGLIEKELNEAENEICRRARNTHTHSTAKNYSVIDYRRATALEALFGYLYLSNQKDRLKYFMDFIIKNKDHIIENAIK